MFIAIPRVVIYKFFMPAASYHDQTHPTWAL